MTKRGQNRNDSNIRLQYSETMTTRSCGRHCAALTVIHSNVISARISADYKLFIKGCNSQARLSPPNQQFNQHFKQRTSFCIENPCRKINLSRVETR